MNLVGNGPSSVHPPGNNTTFSVTVFFRGNDFLGWEKRNNVLKISQNRELTYPTWGSSENHRLKSAGGKRGCVSSQTFTDMRIVKGSWWFHAVNPRLVRP